jgi:alpha-glucuronidase
MKGFLVFVSLGLAAAESGLDGWLRYAPPPKEVVAANVDSIPSKIVLLGAVEGEPVFTAGEELKGGFRAMFSKDLSALEATAGCNSSSTIVVGTAEEYADACGSAPADAHELRADGFWLSTDPSGNVQVIGQNTRGALYGAFEYLSMLAQGNFSSVAYASNPAVPVRWANHWDNTNNGGDHGSIERGYGGESIFFSGNQILSNLTRVTQYARLLASIRINAIVPNNVNADANLLNDKNLDGMARIATALRPYGVQMGMSLNFASPQSVGGLSTFDPLDSSVVSWWGKKTDQIYKLIPDFAGYLVKANSEGQPGPLTYHRTLADGANLFAKAVQPHGGIIMFRAFVYDQLSYSDQKADRANAAVDYFDPLDGKFDDNVVVQIKYGPIDFQVREPASPLFANLLQTNAAIELQITQEYLGQQCHVVYLAPMWKEILDFDLRVNDTEYLVQDILVGKRPGHEQSMGGFAGVVNAGADPTWLGSHLAMSNLYAYGRLAWNPKDDPEGTRQCGRLPNVPVLVFHYLVLNHG